MNLEIPDGVNVQIIVGDTPLLALDSQSTRGTVAGRAGRSHGALLKVFSVVALLGSGFLVGALVGGHHSQATAFPTVPAVRAPPPVAQSYAVTPPGPVPSPTPKIPPPLAERLGEVPTVMPAPGQPPSGTPRRNAFGLEN